MSSATVTSYVCAALLRALVVLLCGVGWQRVEIASVANSRRRLFECVYTWRSTGLPYDGDLCHEQPVFLLLTDWLLRLAGAAALPVAAIVLDLVAAACMARFAGEYVGVMVGWWWVFVVAVGGGIGSPMGVGVTPSPPHKPPSYLILYPGGQARHAASNLSKLPPQLRTDDDPERVQFRRSIPIAQGAKYAELLSALCYLFNPVTVMACASYSGACIDNALSAVAVSAACRGSALFSLGALALLAYRSLHPVALLLPVVLILCQTHRVGDESPKLIWSKAVFHVAVFLALFATLVGCSCALVGDQWPRYLQNTYGFLLTAPDYTPNMGLFWYFFIEMFEHFRTLFLCVFQLNALTYLAPLALLLWRDPFILWVILGLMLATLKPYPSVADAALPLAMLPACQQYFPLLRHTLVVACAALASLALAPVMWHLWIDAYSANANFFFATTLVYNTAIVLLITDLLYARQLFDTFLLFGGRPKIDGKPCRIKLERYDPDESMVAKSGAINFLTNLKAKFFGGK